jgi:putative transposase
MGRRGRNNLINEHFYFVTTTIVRFLHLFGDRQNCNILINNLKHNQKRYKFDILCYVIMPSHFHWIVEVNPKEGTISDIMRDIKKFSAYQIIDRIKEKKDKRIDNILIEEAEKYVDQERKVWQKRFDDEVIRDQKMFWTKLNYIHNNPMKAGLVNKPELFEFSSARNYILDDHSVIEVNTSMGGVQIK